MAELKCTAPACRKVLPSEHMWLPEVKAMAYANGGTHVAVEDFPKYALCGYHGHLLRKSEVKVFRYQQSVEREQAFHAQRQTQELTWAPFADRFKRPEPTNKRPGQHRRNGDGRNVGGGLATCSKVDAAKPRTPKVPGDAAVEPESTEAKTVAPTT